MHNFIKLLTWSDPIIGLILLNPLTATAAMVALLELSLAML